MENEKYIEMLKGLQKAKDKGNGKYKVEKELLYRKKNVKGEEKWIRVTRDCEKIPTMYMLHDHPISAHFSVTKTYEKIRERYYWPRMKQDVEQYVKSCEQCQRRGKPKERMNYTP